MGEFRALNAWSGQGAEFYYWRTSHGTEVDLIWQRGRRAVGIEIKASETWKESFNKGLRTLLQADDIDRAFGVYNGERELRFDRIPVLPYRAALEMAWRGEFSEA